MKEKVFGIGFHKTATTSLAVALYTLGYNVTGYFGIFDRNIADNVHPIAYDLADRFDAAQDTPWFVIYKELDQRYPGSKFVLTMRSPEKWIKSVTKHFKSHHIPAHEWIYGVQVASGNETTYIERFNRHNQEVQDYFRNRPSDLLVMDITQGDGWEKLCPFLEKEQPEFEFPKQNTAKEKSNRLIERTIRFFKRRIAAMKIVDSSNQLPQGVSAVFVRDMFHFHHASFERTWELLKNLSENEFTRKVSPRSISIRDILEEQFNQEADCFQMLREESAIGSFPRLKGDAQSIEDVYQFWNKHRLRTRRAVANISDEGCNSRVSYQNAYLWEVIVHLVNAGIERRTNIQNILRGYEKPADSLSLSFLDFYRSQ